MDVAAKANRIGAGGPRSTKKTFIVEDGWGLERRFADRDNLRLIARSRQVGLKLCLDRSSRKLSRFQVYLVIEMQSFRP